MGTSDANFATVPAGKVWIVRDIVLTNKNSGSTQNAFLNYYIASVANPMLWVQAIPIQTTQVHEGRWVMNAGEIIRGHESGAASGANISLTVHGYEFDAV